MMKAYVKFSLSYWMQPVHSRKQDAESVFRSLFFREIKGELTQVASLQRIYFQLTETTRSISDELQQVSKTSRASSDEL